MSDTKEKDAERRLEAQSELEYLVATLRKVSRLHSSCSLSNNIQKVAVTWPTANVSAGVLEGALVTLVP